MRCVATFPVLQSVRLTYPRPCQESHFAAIIEGEHRTPAWIDIDDEVGVFPGLELGGADVDGSAADITEQNVVVADDEFFLRIAHR